MKRSIFWLFLVRQFTHLSPSIKNVFQLKFPDDKFKGCGRAAGGGVAGRAGPGCRGACGEEPLVGASLGVLGVAAAPPPCPQAVGGRKAHEAQGAAAPEAWPSSRSIPRRLGHGCGMRPDRRHHHHLGSRSGKRCPEQRWQRCPRNAQECRPRVQACYQALAGPVCIMLSSSLNSDNSSVDCFAGNISSAHISYEWSHSRCKGPALVSERKADKSSV